MNVADRINIGCNLLTMFNTANANKMNSSTATIAALLGLIFAVSYAIPIENHGRLTSPRVIGGVEAKEGQFPFQVSIFENLIGRLYFLCSGTILSSKYILTTSSCIIGQWPTITIVRAGEHSMEANTTRRQQIRSWTLITHPDFNYVNHTNDIGVIELEWELEFNEYVQPLKLPNVTEQFPNGTVCRVAGWGEANHGMNPDKNLRYLDVQLISDESCAEGYARENQTIIPSMLCAVNQWGKDLCYGDSGSPLICGNGSIVGVATRGNKCDGSGSPPIYSEVSFYRDFIREYAGV